MKECRRCGRFHSGICGIPPGVTMGFGARVSSPQPRGAPARGASVNTLEALLAQARMHLAKVVETIKATPPELTEHSALLDREAQLEATIKQLLGQIAAKTGVKG